MVVFPGISSRVFILMFTLSDYGIADASHVAMISIFGGTCVSDNHKLGISASCGGFNHHDVDGNGGPDIGHLIELNMEVRLSGRRGQFPEVKSSEILECTKPIAHCPFLFSVVMVWLM